MKNQKSILFYFLTVNICHFAISMLSLKLIHLRVKWLRCNIIGRQFWYDNFFPRMKMILALLRQKKRSIVLPCLCFATGTRKWPRFVRMFMVKCYLLVVKCIWLQTAVNSWLQFTSLIYSHWNNFYGYLFQHDESKRRRSTKQAQCSGKLIALAYVLKG